MRSACPLSTRTLSASHASPINSSRFVRFHDATHSPAPRLVYPHVDRSKGVANLSIKAVASGSAQLVSYPSSLRTPWRWAGVGAARLKL